MLLVDVGRLEYEPVGHPHQTQIFRRHNAERLLDNRRACDPPSTTGAPSPSPFRSARGGRRVGIEQPVQMDDEIAHLRIVDGLLRLGLPGRVGGGVVRIDADDVELVEILELGVVERGSVRRRTRDGAIASAGGFAAIAKSFAIAPRERRSRRSARRSHRARTRSINAACRSRPAATSDAVHRLGPIVEQRLAVERGHACRRLRAPKGRQPQGPSRGCCRRRSRRRASPCADTRHAAARANGCAARQRSGVARRDPFEHALGAGDARAVEAIAGARLDRHAVARRAAARRREEQFVGHRRKQRGQHRPSVLDQRHRDRPVLAAGDEGARAVDRIDHPDAPRGKPRGSFSLSSDSQPSPGCGSRSRSRSLTAMSASVTGESLALGPALERPAEDLQRERAGFAHRGGKPRAVGRACVEPSDAGNGQPLDAHGRRSWCRSGIRDRWPA